MDNLSPTPGAAKDVPAVKNKVTKTAKNAKVRFTTGYYSRFRAGNEPALQPMVLAFKQRTLIEVSKLLTNLVIFRLLHGSHKIRRFLAVLPPHLTTGMT
jgi:hypothetical protein